jgi:glutathione-specific gamma-glutamylcyclotransferase
MADLWVFGYGSLMWRPGFAFEEARPATLSGYRRCFCIYSVHHRGSPRRPGLVLGLDRGGACHGMAFRAAERSAEATLAYLRAREQVNGVYREAVVPLSVGRGQTPIQAVAYLAERAHPSYTGPLTIAQQARLIRAARGLSGPNLDYLANTLAHLAELGIRERELERVLILAGAVFARGEGDQRRMRIEGLVRISQSRPPDAPILGRAARKRFGYRLAVL